MSIYVRVFLATICWLLITSYSFAAEVVVLSESNWDEFAPQGKEVDAIYGDHVLRSDRLIAVVAQASESRHANMTVQGVGGSVIDLTRRDAGSDQLSCFYPHALEFQLDGPVDWPQEFAASPDSARIAFVANPVGPGASGADKLTVTVGYELVDGEDFVTVKTLLKNGTDQPVQVPLADGVRADGEFKFGHDADLKLWWCQDEYWEGAYGLLPVGDELEILPHRDGRPLRIEYAHAGEPKVEVPAGGSFVFDRKLIPAANTLEIAARARELRGIEQAQVQLKVGDPDGPVENALVRFFAGDRLIGSARTATDGVVATSLPPGEYRASIASSGREVQNVTLSVSAAQNVFDIDLIAPGYVEGKIVDESGRGVPCKIAFEGRGVASPNFGPDSAIHGVRNLWHTHDGTFRVPLIPGEYDLLISRGPEYDAITKTIALKKGETTFVKEQLRRTVDTTGWISAELHSHSSPSGDNTASQRGRVLNLLVDHLEFIPCTEHQRISTYQPHLEHFDATKQVLTCTGMELTGSPLPINHQNVFPLTRRDREQDGGGPVIDSNPEVQIERIAMWDDQSDKVVQINHPDIVQMVGDRNLDGKPDEGFRQMFYFADVIEVHPPAAILADLPEGPVERQGRGNAIQDWMRLLNLGYRVPGVVNTDAHWNFHGSGWLRNYVRASSDNPADADLREVCHALERGQVVMTNGPFLEAEASSGGESAGPGEDLRVADGKVRLAVKVQCPNWLDVNRVQVFVNGRPAQEYNFTRRTHGEMFGDGVVKFDQAIELELEEDAHLIVAAAAEGRTLGKVYGPDQGNATPIAVSNPLFVDVDGDGFTPNGDALGAPLPVEAGHRPTHGHNHPHPHHTD